MGTLHFAAFFFAVILSPKASITSGLGPIKIIPFLAHCLAKLEFSERNPYPG